MTVPTPTSPGTEPAAHPTWCSADEPPGRSHRSRPRVIATDWGQTTIVYLERSDMRPGDRDLPTLLVVEQLLDCPEADDSDHDAHACREPDLVAFRMPEARAFIAMALDLVEGHRDINP